MRRTNVLSSLSRRCFSSPLLTNHLVTNKRTSVYFNFNTSGQIRLTVEGETLGMIEGTRATSREITGVTVAIDNQKTFRRTINRGGQLLAINAWPIASGDNDQTRRDIQLISHDSMIARITDVQRIPRQIKASKLITGRARYTCRRTNK